MQVRTTFALTLSPIPRKFTMATSTMKRRPTSVMPAFASARSKLVDKLAAKVLEAVDADVMPEHITAKATRKVTK